MNFKIFLKISWFLILIKLPLGVLATFFDERLISTYLILSVSTIIDILFILRYKQFLLPNWFEKLLIYLILLSLFIGIINTLTFSRRIFTDISNPLLFILKIVIIRNILYINENLKLLQSFIKEISFQLVYVAILSLGLFYFLSVFKPMYAGITPTLHLFFTYGLINSNAFYQLFSILLILLSGKRALLLSTIVIFIYYNLGIKKRINVFFNFIIGVSIFILFFIISGVDLSNNAAYGKYKWTYEMIMENTDDLNLDNAVLNKVTAGRLAEVLGATQKLSWFDYFLGKGVGFTYSYFNLNLNDEISEYANLHFSPLSIITKYGFIFFVILIIYYFSWFDVNSKKNLFYILFGLYIVGSFVDMLFAYTIFVDPLIPLALGYLFYNKKRNKDSFIHFT